MKKNIPFSLLAFFVFFSLKMQAQTILDETVETLEQKIKADSTLVKRLGDRFRSDDKSMTINELSTIYYGYALRSNYNPVQEDRILDAAKTLARRDKYADALRLIDNFLEKNPGCLAAWLERGYTAWLAEDSLQTVLTYDKYYRLLDVPMKTGNGESFATAIVVSSQRDVELIVDKLGYMVNSTAILQHDGQAYQRVTCVKEADKKATTTFFFNIQLPVKHGLQSALNQRK